MSPADRQRWLHAPLRISRLSARPLILPLASPLVTGRGRHVQRETLLIEADLHIDDLTATGWGEAARLEGWTEGDQTDFVRFINNIALPIELESVLDLDSAMSGLIPRPALRAGVEGALVDALARTGGLSVAGLLAAHRAVHRLTGVQVQRTLGSDDLDASLAAVGEAAAAGFAAVKLKVGAASPAEDLERVARLAEAYPDLEFRLDANGAWDVTTACRMLARLPAALVEQPVAPRDLAVLLQRYGRRTSDRVRIAADESCSSPAAANALIAEGRIDALVIKPVTLGGTLPALRVVEQALAAGIDVIVSNLMESAVGRGHAAALAAAFPELPGPHGLATGAWLAGDVVDAPETIADGRLRIPQSAPGLGFVPQLQ